VIAFLVEQGIGLVLLGVFVGAVVSDLTRPRERASRVQPSAEDGGEPAKGKVS
jgi:hypothetical protein